MSVNDTERLDRIREKRSGDEGTHVSTNRSRKSRAAINRVNPETTVGGVHAAIERTQGSDTSVAERTGGLAEGTGGIGQEPRTLGRLGGRSGRPDGESDPAAQSAYQGDGSYPEVETYASPADYEETEEEKQARQSELNRLRQQAFRDRQREKSVVETVKDNVTQMFARPESEVKPPEKKLTNDEADSALEKMVYMYVQFADLLDEVLKAVVKDHEEVAIWHLDEDEATQLATFQISAGKKDPQAAKTVRAIVRVYDKLYLYMLGGPKVIATFNHIKEHGGLSLR